MATFKTHTTYIDLDTGEIINPGQYQENYYTVRKKRSTYQPDKTKSFIIIKILHECRKKPQNLEIWKK